MFCLKEIPAVINCMVGSLAFGPALLVLSHSALGGEWGLCTGRADFKASWDRWGISVTKNASMPWLSEVCPTRYRQICLLSVQPWMGPFCLKGKPKNRTCYSCTFTTWPNFIKAPEDIRIWSSLRWVSPTSDFTDKATKTHKALLITQMSPRNRLAASLLRLWNEGR